VDHSLCGERIAFATEGPFYDDGYACGKCIELAVPE
jgi:hypothetical protein